MFPRNLKQAHYEQSIFQTLLDAYPSLAACVRTIFQPDDDFPDVVSTQPDGSSALAKCRAHAYALAGISVNRRIGDSL